MRARKTQLFSPELGRMTHLFSAGLGRMARQSVHKSLDVFTTRKTRFIAHLARLTEQTKRVAPPAAAKKYLRVSLSIVLSWSWPSKERRFSMVTCHGSSVFFLSYYYTRALSSPQLHIDAPRSFSEHYRLQTEKRAGLHARPIIHDSSN